MKILRLGHRAGRDDRISTHVGLTARQWGADEIVYCGEKDTSMMESLQDTVERWGGEMNISYREDYEKVIREFEGLIVHLTMYGERINDKESEIKDKIDSDELMIVVGAEKVSKKVYKMADYNIGVGNQPHSEIAALAVFMDRFFDIRELYDGANMEVKPSKERKLTREI